MKKLKMMKCSICHLSVDQDEHYLILHEMNKAQSLSINYYHAKCFAEKMLVQQQIKAMMGDTSKVIKQLVSRIS